MEENTLAGYVRSRRSRRRAAMYCVLLIASVLLFVILGNSRESPPSLSYRELVLIRNRRTPRFYT